MSDATVTAIVTALPPTLVALGGLVIAVRNGRKTDKVSDKADAAAEHAAAAANETQAIKAQANVIKSQTDGQLDKMREEIKSLRDELIQVYRENAALHSILSAREGKAAGEAVRRDDPIVPLTGRPSGNGKGNQHRRRTDTHDDDDKEPTS